MRIRLTRPGLNVAGATRARGEEVDVDPDVAAYLVEGGQAVRVRSGGTVIETTMTGPDEATTRTRRRTRREP